jgi:uroporphyrin-3 C-methyltransferase
VSDTNTDTTPTASLSDSNSTTSQAAPQAKGKWSSLFSLLGIFLSLIALILVWQVQQRLADTEKEMVERHQKSYLEAQEAIKSARLSEDTTRATAAKMALAEAKLIEIAAQRSQVDELVQSLSRGRDENLLADIDSAIRVAQQYGELTGSTDPVINTLRQIDDRLQRQNQGRYEVLRKAIATDLEKMRQSAGADIASLSGRLDALSRDVDTWPLLMTTPIAPPKAQRIPQAAPTQAHPDQPSHWWAELLQWGDDIWAEVRQEIFTLVRVAEIAHPEAALMAPEQSYYLRENLKLRLLNARLALQTRQFGLFQTDLQAIQSLLGRYFDAHSAAIKKAQSSLQAIQTEAQSTQLPSPTETLTALSSINSGR